MPKLQRNNDKSLLNKSKDVEKSIYIYCLRRKNQPRIHILICDKCKYRNKCANYQVAKGNISIDEYDNIKPKPRRKYKKRIKK